MDLVPNDKERGLKTPVWDEYKLIVNRAEGHEVIWGYRGTWVQGNMGTGEHGYRGTWVQGNMGTGEHGYRGTWVQGNMGTGEHGYRGTWVQGNMGCRGTSLCCIHTRHRLSRDNIWMHDI